MAARFLNAIGLAGLLALAPAAASCQRNGVRGGDEDPAASERADEVEPGPGSRGSAIGAGSGGAGADLVGNAAPDWQVDEWENVDAPLRLEDLRGRVVVVRFWTDTCPYCEASLPAIQTLADEFAGEPVTFVGLYHSKPLGSERPWQTAVDAARDWGVEFPIGYDREWNTVTSWWLSEGRARATSASFVIGPRGRIVHVHPGPVLFPSDDPDEAEQDRDFREMRGAIAEALERAGS